MDIFNRKKLAKLKYELITLQEENEHLKAVIKNKGYIAPEEKTLWFKNDDPFIVDSHFSSVINFMNANNVEIVKVNSDRYSFMIKYKLPPHIKSMNFEYNQGCKSNGTVTYTSKFTFTDDKP